MSPALFLSYPVRVLLIVVLLKGSMFAEHPQLLLDSTELNFIRAKVTSNSADWRRLKQICDDLTTFSVQWPDAITGGSNLVRGYVTGSPRSHGVIYTGFNGGRFDATITELGVCYQATKLSAPATAATYLAQAHNIITAIAQPPLTLTRQTDGAIRYAASLDAHGKDLRAGAPLGVYLPYSTTVEGGDPSKNLHVGEVWSISGATGCTSMNGTWRVSAKGSYVISFSNVDGSPAPALNANCTLFTFEPMLSGYPLRFWVPALARAYDWFFDGLTPTEKANLLYCMNAWMYELAITGVHSGHPEENFSFSNIWALVAAFVATDGDNPSWTSFYTNRITDRLMGPHQLREYRQLWMGGGGFGEGWQAYGYNATRSLMDAMLAMKVHGTDWTQPPFNFNFVDDTLRYWMQFTTPSKLALDDNEFVYPISITDKSVTEPVWIPLGHAVMFEAAAQRFKSQYAAQFQSWYQEVYGKLRSAAGKSVPSWDTGAYNSQPTPVDEFLYYDQNASSSDWKKLPLMYRAWSGNYAVSRSDWSDGAVEVTLLGGPPVGHAGNGKTQFNSGSVTVQRGNDRLVVFGMGEAARSGDILNLAQFEALHHERGTYGNKKNPIFWAGANLSDTRNQGLTSRIPPPGHMNSTTSWGSSIDRAEDVDAYTYWRANGLEANNAKSSIDGKYHQTAWTREVLFLRPKLVMVHDRTTVLNNTDDRAMIWTFGRNVAPVQAPSGLARYDASFKGIYRGAFTSVLPVAPAVSVTDHANMHFLYRVEVRPSAMDHQSDNWLAILDAADAPQKVNSITHLTATNADAVKVDDADHTVVAFSQSSPPKLPITLQANAKDRVYVAGLDPKTAYSVSFSDSAVTISADDGTHKVTSSEAGVVALHQ